MLLRDERRLVVIFGAKLSMESNIPTSLSKWAIIGKQGDGHEQPITFSQWRLFWRLRAFASLRLAWGG